MCQSATREPGISLYQCLNLVSFITAHITQAELGWFGSRQSQFNPDTGRCTEIFNNIYMCEKHITSVTDKEYSSADFSHTQSLFSVTDKSVLLNVPVWIDFILKKKQ